MVEEIKEEGLMKKDSKDKTSKGARNKTDQ
jgi:hypothetical protein